jgi:iron(III) transport system substrate-binding protein
MKYWIAGVLAAVTMVMAGCGGKSPEVVIYTSQDEVYAEPIFKDFEQQTGIRVRPVYDSEAVKTVGLVNRLLQESANPQCDVFWNNEEFRTRQLLAHGVFRETNAWAELGYRSRRMVINTNLLSPANAPKTFSDVTNVIWRGKVALAYPLFGTTSTHFLALRQRWGDAAWQTWCRALAANQPKVVDGNSVAAKLVGRGEAWIGFADSDDIAAEQNNGSPVIALPVGDDTLFLANTVAVVRGAPHPAAAERFFEYLQQKEVSQRLVDVHALEGATLDAATASQGVKVDWDSLLKDLDAATKEMEQIFLR